MHGFTSQYNIDEEFKLDSFKYPRMIKKNIPK
jgi:hypothetical protein